MFCTKCGKQIEDVKFCPYCGSAVEAKKVGSKPVAGEAAKLSKSIGNENEIQAARDSINNTQKPKNKKGLKVFLTVLIIVLVLAGGGFSLYYFVIRDDSSSIEDKGKIELASKTEDNNVDGAVPDAGPEDEAVPDAGPEDEVIPDAGPEDGAVPDAGPEDGAVPDAGPEDDTASDDSADDSISSDESSESVGDDTENGENTSSENSTPDNTSDVGDELLKDEEQNEHEHSFWAATGDVCQICGEEFPADMIECDVVFYAVDNGVAVRDIYYNSGKNLRYLVKGEEVRAVAMIYNAKSNLWFQLENGGFVFGDNLTEEHVEPDEAEWHSHEFAPETGDVCIICGQEFEADIYDYDGGLYSVKDSVPVRDFYYNSGEVVRYLEKGEYIYADYYVINEKGSIWYSVGDGYVYGLNLSAEKPVE